MYTKCLKGLSHKTMTIFDLTNAGKRQSNE